MKKFGFRVDAALYIGAGHVMRCLTLADSLRAKGHQCHFICREHPGHLVQKIKGLGFDVYILPIATISNTELKLGPYTQWLGADWPTDAQQTSLVLKALNLDWLIIDHYAIDRDWEELIQRQHPHLKIMVIDDLANRHHHCRILLDQNLGRQASDYLSKVDAECRIFAGTEYVMLRSEFNRLRPYSLARRITPQLNNILISMGGIDNDNATSIVLRTLEQTLMPISTKITAVIGASAPHVDHVKAIAARMPYSTEVVVNANNMAQLIADSDLAIGASGSSSWERCHLGLPTLIVVLASNQQTACQALEQEQAAISIGHLSDIPIRLPSLIHSLFQKPQTLKKLSDRAAKLCNNAGFQQIITQLLR